MPRYVSSARLIEPTNIKGSTIRRASSAAGALVHLKYRCEAAL